MAGCDMVINNAMTVAYSTSLSMKLDSKEQLHYEGSGA